MRLRVLIVDDSPWCRSVLRTVLESDPEVEVVGEAADGAEVVERIHTLQPTLVLLDLQMPRMGGLETIEWIMRHRPTPIVVVTERPRIDGVDQTFAALSRGALELVPKSNEWREGTPEANALIARLKRLVLEATQLGANAPARERPRRAAVGAARPEGWTPAIVGIGASTGGPATVAELLRGLNFDYALPIVLVQHMDAEFQQSFVVWLSRLVPLPVRLARDGDLLQGGEVLVAPSGVELLIRSGQVKLTERRAGSAHAPSVDGMFTSIAEEYGNRAIGVLLTGMGSDGAAGMRALRSMGAVTLAQDRASCVIYGMPRAAVELGAVEASGPVSALSSWLVEFARKPFSGASQTTWRGSVAKQKILIVDDSPVVLEAGRMLLEDAGYEVLTLDNPLALAAMMRKEDPDLVLIDVNMPAVSGDVVTRIVSQHGLVRKTPVVLFSDSPASELKNRAEACGASGFLQKSGDDVAFLEGIRQFIRR